MLFHSAYEAAQHAESSEGNAVFPSYLILLGIMKYFLLQYCGSLSGDAVRSAHRPDSVVGSVAWPGLYPRRSMCPALRQGLLLLWSKELYYFDIRNFKTMT